MPTSRKHLTRLLLAWNQGDDSALERLMPVIYDELKQLAHRYMNREQPGHMLQTTALVNEAYMRLIDAKQVSWTDRAHFFAVSSRVMRRVLVDFARTRKAAKRGGELEHVELREELNIGSEPDLDLVALDEALHALAEFDERKSRVVELRFFGGLSVKETAEVLQISVDTVMRDWKFARVWLLRAMTQAPDPPSE